MNKCRKLFSYSFMDYGDHVSIELSDRVHPVFVCSHTNNDMAMACRELASEMLELAYQYDHAKDFCTPEWDDKEKKEQLEKLKNYMEMSNENI